MPNLDTVARAFEDRIYAETENRVAHSCTAVQRALIDDFLPFIAS